MVLCMVHSLFLCNALMVHSGCQNPAEDDPKGMMGFFGSCIFTKFWHFGFSHHWLPDPRFALDPDH